MTEPPINRDPAELGPAFRQIVTTILGELNAHEAARKSGVVWKLNEGYRTAERQEWLYAKGRTTPGPKVTDKNGTTNKSVHQSRNAADLIPVRNGVVDWKGEFADWDYLGHLARQYKLTWGGDWKGLVDKPHIQMA